MADGEEIEGWLGKAEEDWKAADLLLTSSEELTLPCLFHLQQMLEKLLKALLLKQEKPIERTHDLSWLIHLAALGGDEELLELAESLTIFAVNARYPGDSPTVAVSQARRFFEACRLQREKLLGLLRAG